MDEKPEVPCITDTVLVDGIYHCERRDRPERRQYAQNLVRYERRQNRDRRYPISKSVDEIV